MTIFLGLPHFLDLNLVGVVLAGLPISIYLNLASMHR